MDHMEWRIRRAVCAHCWRNLKRRGREHTLVGTDEVVVCQATPETIDEVRKLIEGEVTLARRLLEAK